MKHIFSPEGQRALQGLVAGQPLLAFDFDGTLAPIVESPGDARVAAGVVQRLIRLAAWRPVAVVTGRAVADVRTRLGFEPAYVVGNHGAEDPRVAASQASQAALQIARERLAEYAQHLFDAGVTVEDKGGSMALHYRSAPDRDKAVASIDRVVAGLDGALETFGGKCVVNLVAAGAPDKGDAVQRLVQESGSDAAFFAGDDVNDEAVFELAPPHWLTVRVGHDARVSKAQYFLESQDEMAELLQRMLDFKVERSAA
jgi:trehalose 6-phosphate phosphatase